MTTLTKCRAPSIQPILRWWKGWVPGLRRCRNLPCLLNSAVTAKFEVQPAVGNYLLPRSSGRPSSWLAEDALHLPQSLFQHLWVRPRCNVKCGLTLTFWEEPLSKCTTDPRGVADYLPVPSSIYLCRGATQSLCGSVAPCGERSEMKASANADLYRVDCAWGGKNRKKVSITRLRWLQEIDRAGKYNVLKTLTWLNHPVSNF